MSVFIEIGDMTMTLVRRVRTNLDDVDTYILSVHDVVTGIRGEMSFVSENEAMQTIAAWILAEQVGMKDMDIMLDERLERMMTNIPGDFYP